MAARSASRTSVEVQPPQFDRPEVEIHASTRRTKTGAAHWSGSRVIVQIPARLRGRDRDAFVDALVERVVRHRPQNAAGDAALEGRCRTLATMYTDGVTPSSVRWVSNQRARWASCSPATREIRVSSRLRQCPEWVIDAVLVHELAHLHEVDHSVAFHEIADRYPRQRDASIFLEGLALGLGLAVETGDVDPSID